MLFPDKPFILNMEDLPETCLLVPGRFEAIIATAHCDKAIRIPVREEQFLINTGIYKQRSFLVLDFGLGSDSLLLLCRELYRKKVKNYFLLSPVLSLSKKRPVEEVVYSDSSILADDQSKIALKNKLPISTLKKESSLTLNLAGQVLREKQKLISEEKTVKILSAYDHYFFSFLNKNDLRGLSIHYFPDEVVSISGEPDTSDNLVNYKQALLQWFELIAKPL